MGERRWPVRGGTSRERSRPLGAGPGGTGGRRGVCVPVTGRGRKGLPAAERGAGCQGEHREALRPKKREQTGMGLGRWGLRRRSRQPAGQEAGSGTHALHHTVLGCMQNTGLRCRLGLSVTRPEPRLIGPRSPAPTLQLIGALLGMGGCHPQALGYRGPGGVSLSYTKRASFWKENCGHREGVTLQFIRLSLRLHHHHFIWARG